MAPHASSPDHAPKPPPDAVSDLGFAILKQAIIARTGHHYYADKDNLLRDRLDRRLKATGCGDLRDYLALLGQPAAGAEEWQELEAEVTIGETFFFRHEEQFAALRDVILPAIVAQNAPSRRLRIWSAGCAIGAEPYSIVILLERLLGKAMDDWTIEILGSDISHRVLAQARDGRFSNWALRGMAEAERARDFEAMPDRRQWRIADRHRLRVRFIQHNLLALLGDSPGGEWQGFDLILCRNVLIYFSADRISPMLSALTDCLRPTGWLMVGHSDAIAVPPRALGVVQLPGTIAFRPPGLMLEPASPGDERAAPPEPAPPEPVPPEPAPLLPERVAERRRGPPLMARQQMAPEASVAAIRVLADAGRLQEATLACLGAIDRHPLDPRMAPEASVAAIRVLADAGRLQEATLACLGAIDRHPLDPRLHFYDGVVAQAAGQRTRAEAALRRAIYLSGSMVMAQYQLGLLLLDGATPEAGRRIMAHVVTLCAALPESEALPESDGLTPRDLAQRIEMRLRPRAGRPAPGG